MILRLFCPRATINTCIPRLQLSRPVYRTLIAAPTASSGPLLSRRSDRALPPLPNSYSIWLRTIPVFVAVITVSALAIFNYQKASSSVVNSTLYALRTSEAGRRELGDEIYFRDKFPWIWGEMNQLHGRIDISFRVKGTKGTGMMKFKSTRKTRMGYVSFPYRVTSVDFARSEMLILRHLLVSDTGMEPRDGRRANLTIAGRGEGGSVHEYSIRGRGKILKRHFMSAWSPLTNLHERSRAAAWVPSVIIINLS